MLNDQSSVLAFMSSRRSASAKAMHEPGPDEAQLQKILQIAVRVPDHGKLTPWRFIQISGDSRKALGEVLAERWRKLNPSHGEEANALQENMFLRAPVIVAVISTAKKTSKIPEWEQQLSAGAVCQNMLIAAGAMGIGSQWVTGWYAYDDEVRSALGVSEDEQVAGFIYFGTANEELSDRPRPDPNDLLHVWEAN